MQIDKHQLQTIMRDTGNGRLQSIAWLADGYYSRAYQITTNKALYVLLERKHNNQSADAFRRHYATLKYLEKLSYRHAPRPIYLSQDGGILITTKLSGRTAQDLSFLSESKQKQVAFNILDAMSELDGVTYESFVETFQDLNIALPEISDQESDYQTYVIDSFYPYKDFVSDKALVRWLENVITHFRPQFIKGDQKVFWHGDPSGGNILVDDELNIGLIDWTLARFVIVAEGRNDYGLSYMSNHVPVIDKYSAVLSEDLIHKYHLDRSSFNKLIYANKKLSKLSDVCWAFKMYAQTLHKDIIENPSVYKDILEQRIRFYERTFQ